MLMTAIIVSVISFFIVRFLGFGIKRLAFTFVVSFILLGVLDYLFTLSDLGVIGALLLIVPIAIGSTFLFEPSDAGSSHGSARWGKKKDAQNAGHLTNEGFCLGAFGKADKGQLFHHKGHVLTCAPTGAGKGVGAVIPNLLKYQGSSLVIDIKGENYAVTARTRREMGQAVHLVDPFGVVGGGSSFNWLDRINPKSPDVVSESAALVEMLVVTDPNADQYWDDSAKDLLRGLVVYVASLPDELRNIGEVRKLLTS
ncbi:type IV secretory system conjugative DNA transfer family protein, partial [Vibrio cholerae]|uniref:type IV secretory system conjugative DNA transfer family protein n=1 Tax=Vibrio cholerae TaxID=666 RepID=UPI002934F1E7